MKDSNFKAGNIKANDWPSITNAGDLLSKSPIYTDDSANMTFSDMQSKVREFSNEHKNGVCVIENVDTMLK